MHKIRTILQFREAVNVVISIKKAHQIKIRAIMDKMDPNCKRKMISPRSRKSESYR